MVVAQRDTWTIWLLYGTDLLALRRSLCNQAANTKQRSLAISTEAGAGLSSATHQQAGNFVMPRYLGDVVCSEPILNTERSAEGGVRDE